MIAGWLTQVTERPLIYARVTLPRLGIVGSIPFLIDTGAGGTVLAPDEARALGIRTEHLILPHIAYGLGGELQVFRERAAITFVDSDGLAYEFQVDLSIVPPLIEDQVLPSLLGRDVLNRVRLVVDACHDEVELIPHRPDHIFPIGDLDSP